MLIDGKNDKGLSTQRPLQEIKSNRPNSYNTETFDGILEDNIDADASHIHNNAAALECDPQPDQFDAPTEEPSETNKPPTLGHAMATINQYETNDTQPQSVEDKILYSNYFLNLE